MTNPNSRSYPEQTTDHKLSEKELRDLLASLKDTPGMANEPVLAVNQEMMMIGKNKGFPKHMHSPDSRPAEIVINRAQETMLIGQGYSNVYRHKEYPKFVHRRNNDPRYESSDFVESKQVLNEEAEDALNKIKAKPGQGPWEDSVTDLEPLDETPTEDPKITIARLQGQLAAKEGKTATT